jgi:hypothetical protein
MIPIVQHRLMRQSELVIVPVIVARVVISVEVRKVTAADGNADAMTYPEKIADRPKSNRILVDLAWLE